jgi:8-oxo-dGTP pyrophosphatase MutT (NUDIX family)
VHRRVALLAVLPDGRIIVDPDQRLPATGIGPDTTIADAARNLERRIGMAPGTPAETVVDVTENDDGALTHHHILWRSTEPRSHPAPPYRAEPFGQVLAALPAPEAARLRAAGRAVLLGDTVRLTSGRRPGARPTKAERTRARFTWCPGIAVPAALEVRQVWGWLTDPFGRVLVLLDSGGVPSLPGGRPETGENPVQTLAREAAEEASASLGTPVLLGYQQGNEHERAPYGQLRMTAPLLGLGPATPDPDSGETYRRVLVPLQQANLLLGWGREGDDQAAVLADTCPTAVPGGFLRVPEAGWVPVPDGAVS